MMKGQLGENALAFGSECEQDFAAVVLGAIAADISTGLETVDEFDGAVMANLHARGQFADNRADSGGHAFDRQHELVLAALEPRGLHGLLAKMEELPNLVAEFGEGLVVGQG